MACGNSNWRTLVLIVSLLIYLCIGAVIFMLLEAPIERKLRDKLLYQKKDFLKNHTCISGKDFLLKSLIRMVLVLVPKTGNKCVVFLQNHFSTIYDVSLTN